MIAKPFLATSTAIGVLLAVQMLVFLPHLGGDGIFLPASVRLVAPFADGRPLPIQDAAATDKIVFTLPNVLRIRRAWREDPRLLLWQPDVLCGYPFWATQDTFALYPLNVIFLLDDVTRAFLWSAVLHGFLLSFGMFLLIRRTGCSYAASLFGAASAGVSPWVLAHVDLVNFVQALTWIPFLAYGGLLILDGGGRARASCGGACVTLSLTASLLGGMAQITFIGLLGALVAWTLVLPRSIRSAGTRTVLRRLVRLGAFGVLGATLAAPQLLPTLEMARHSRRARLEPTAIDANSLGTRELLEVCIPGLFGDAASLDRAQRRAKDPLPPGVGEGSFVLARWAHAGTTGRTFFERAAFGSVVALILAGMGTLRRPSRSTVLGLSWVLLGLAGAMDTPIQDWLTKLGPFAFGNPRRFLALTALGLPLLSARGFEEFARRPGFDRAVAGLFAAGAGFAAAVSGFWPRAMLAAFEIPPQHPQATFAASWVTSQGLVATAFASAVLLVALLPCLQRERRRLAAMAMILVGEAAFMNQRWNPCVPAGEFPGQTATTRRLAEILPSDRRFLRFGAEGSLPPLPPNLGLLYGLRDLQGYEGVLDSRIEDLMELVEPGSTVSNHLIREVRDPDAFASPILDLLAAEIVITTRPLDLPLVDAILEDGVGIYRRPGALSRVSVVRRLGVMAEDSDVLAHLASAEFKPREEAVLTRGDAEAAFGGGWAIGWHDVDGAEARARLVSETATEITVELEGSHRPTYLLVADTFHPDWQAEMNGTRVPTARADHALRLVALPSGVGQVRLRFRPRSWEVGLWVSIASGIALLALTMGWRCGRRSGIGTASPEVHR